MTYDRLVPQPQADQFYAVKVDRSGYRAIHIPPTAKLGPQLAYERAQMRDKDIAVKNSPYFSSERRDFFISRLPYWDKWSQKPSGIVYLADRE